MADSVESLGEIIKDYAKKYQQIYKHVFGQDSPPTRMEPIRAVIPAEKKVKVVPLR